MLEYLEQNQEDLQGVLAVYNSQLIYYPCDNKGDITNGELLKVATAKKIFETLNNIDLVHADFGFDDLIPYNVLHFSKSEKKVIWYSEPRKEALLFIEKLNMPEGIFPLPYLLWKLTDNGLSLWALKERPTTKQTILYHAPFLNINEKGEVCMGNTKFLTESKDYALIIKAVENAFFWSNFTHTNHNHILKTSIAAVYSKIVNTALFDNEELLKTGLTIDKIL